MHVWRERQFERLWVNESAAAESPKSSNAVLLPLVSTVYNVHLWERGSFDSGYRLTKGPPPYLRFSLYYFFAMLNYV